MKSFSRAITISVCLALSACGYFIPPDKSTPRYNSVIGEPRRPALNSQRGATPTPPPEPQAQAPSYAPQSMAAPVPVVESTPVLARQVPEENMAAEGLGSSGYLPPENTRQPVAWNDAPVRRPVSGNPSPAIAMAPLGGNSPIVPAPEPIVSAPVPPPVVPAPSQVSSVNVAPSYAPAPVSYAAAPANVAVAAAPSYTPPLLPPPPPLRAADGFAIPYPPVTPPAPVQEPIMLRPPAPVAQVSAPAVAPTLPGKPSFNVAAQPMPTPVEGGFNPMEGSNAAAGVTPGGVYASSGYLPPSRYAWQRRAAY